MEEFDLSEEEEIVENNKKENLIEEVLFKRTKILISPLKEKELFTIFSFQNACNLYGIDFEECAVIVYLYELGLFDLKINVLKKIFNLKVYRDKGFIEEDFSDKNKKIYKLSILGNKICKEILEFDFNKVSFENRKESVVINEKIKDTISSYFNKKTV